MTQHLRLRFETAVAAAAMALVTPAFAQQQHVGDQPEALNMRLVGYNDLQARSAYQPTIQQQGDRTILYVGHHGGSTDIPKPLNPMTGEKEFNGTSVVDVTDPTQPKYLKHIPGTEGLGEQGGAQMVRTCAGKDLPKGDPSKYYLLRVYGGQGHEIWDVTDPANPSLLTRIVMGLKDTHKSWWECDTGVAYLVSGVPGWRVKRMAQVTTSAIRPSPCISATSACPARSLEPPAPCRPTCTARSPPARKATASISATVPTRAA